MYKICNILINTTLSAYQSTKLIKKNWNKETRMEHNYSATLGFLIKKVIFSL